jgi:hypothetical protein
MNDFEDAALALQSVDDRGLSQVSLLVRQQLLLERRVADLEEELAAEKKRLTAISDDLLPAALAENGLTKLRMADGSEVSVSTFYGASIPKERTSEAFEWLHSNGFDDLIKNQVSASFGRGQDELANFLVGRLEEEGFNASRKVWIEPVTLKAFVKEQIEAGNSIPTDLFGIFVGEKAKIRRK